MRMIVSLLRVITSLMIGLTFGLISLFKELNSTVGDFKTHATIKSVGIVFEYSGDNNQDNLASIRYRQSKDQE